MDHDDDAMNLAAAVSNHRAPRRVVSNSVAAQHQTALLVEFTSASVSRSNFSPSSKVQCSIAWP